MWEEGSDFLNHVAAFESLARSCGLRSEITAAGLVSNACLLATRRWCVLSESEWRDWMEFDYSHFPSVAPVRDEYNVSGGSTTVRVEGSVALSAAAGETNAISGKAAAKVFGSIGGKRVTSAPARLVLPAFSFVRLVPYGPGAAGRYGMASLEHVRSIMGLMGVPESLKASPYYLRLLQMYNSNEYRELAEKWYSSHCHGSSCCPPQPPGGEPGGGTPYGM